MPSAMPQLTVIDECFMAKKLRYPNGFSRPNAIELGDEVIQRLVDEMMDEGLVEKATGDTLVRRVVEKEGVYEIVEVYKLKARSENIVEN